MNNKSERLKLGLCCLLLCNLILLVACEKTPAKPASINPNDACFYCKAPITDMRFAAEFVTKSGFTRKFDDFGCLIASARKVGKKNISAFFATDLQSKAWVPAEQAQFVRSDKFNTPKNGGIIAFQDQAEAQAWASRYQAELLKLDDLVK